jgi:hypothetical protein
MKKDNYYIFVICGYIAFLTFIVCILSVPTIWQIGISIVAAIFIATTMYFGRGSIAGSHLE